jgi:hypothetical protein
VTQIQGAVLPSIECKSIKTPKVKLNITPPPVTSFALSSEEVTHMVDQDVSASLANRLQKIIDGSIDNRFESALDSKVRSTMLCVNNETAKKLNFSNLMLCRLSLVFSITILKITAITLIWSRSVVFYVHPIKWGLMVQQLRLHLAKVPMLIQPLISIRIHPLLKTHHGIILSMFTNNCVRSYMNIMV